MRVEIKASRASAQAMRCPSCRSFLCDDAWVSALPFTSEVAHRSARVAPCLHTWLCRECGVSLYVVELSVLSPERRPARGWANDGRHRYRSSTGYHVFLGAQRWFLQHHTEVTWVHTRENVGPYRWLDTHSLGPYPALADASETGTGATTVREATTRVLELCPHVLSAAWDSAVEGAGSIILNVAA